MGDWPILSDGGALAEYGGTKTTPPNVDSTQYTQITAGAANVKGAWVQLVASCQNANGIWVTIAQPSLAGNYLIDIGIGAVGSEIVIISDLYYCSQSNARMLGTTRFFPIFIPAGTRIAARCQSPNAAATLYVGVTLLAQGFMPSAVMSRVTTYGANETTSRGINVDGGATAHTKSAWVEISASMANPAKLLNITPGFGNAAHGASAVRYIFDIGIGAVGSEVVIIPDCFTCGFTYYAIPDWLIFPVSIPAATRTSRTDAKQFNYYR